VLQSVGGVVEVVQNGLLVVEEGEIAYGGHELRSSEKVRRVAGRLRSAAATHRALNALQVHMQTRD
jgi:hypothetical protein